MPRAMMVCMQEPGPRRVERSATDRWIGGVAGGLGQHFGMPAWVFRVVFVGSALAWGMGVVAYLLLWAFLPLRADPAAQSASGGIARPGATWDVTGLLGLIALGLGLLLVASDVWTSVRFSVLAPLVLLGAGVVVLWRQSDEAQRGDLRTRAQAGFQAAEEADRAVWLRVLVGLLLVLGGVVGIVGPRVDLWTGLRAVLAAGAVVAGVALIALPWISTWAKRLQAERMAAVRAEERASMAARVHDSVLQTLTLIQRRAEDPREVVRLARAEERALRGWLYAPPGPSGSLAAALSAIASDTEADYGGRVDLVVVGDVVVDGRVAALVAATREAVVNAAKHAGSPATVYVEVGADQVEVNVRDRGVGFDPGAVGPDRHGVRESIVARLAAAGGAASIRSAPDEGTEVRLVLPKEAGDD